MVASSLWTGDVQVQARGHVRASDSQQTMNPCRIVRPCIVRDDTSTTCALPCLALPSLPDLTAPICLAHDASQVCWGGVTQNPRPVVRPCAFGGLVTPKEASRQSGTSQRPILRTSSRLESKVGRSQRTERRATNSVPFARPSEQVARGVVCERRQDHPSNLVHRIRRRSCDHELSQQRVTKCSLNTESMADCATMRFDMLEHENRTQRLKVAAPINALFCHVSTRQAADRNGSQRTESDLLCATMRTSSSGQRKSSVVGGEEDLSERRCSFAFLSRT